MQTSILIILIIYFIMRSLIKQLSKILFANNFQGGHYNRFFIQIESFTKVAMSVMLIKTVIPNDALIARPEAWSIESTNIILAMYEKYFVLSRSEDCSTIFLDSAFLHSVRQNNKGST